MEAPNRRDTIFRIFEEIPPPGWENQAFFTNDDVRREYLLQTLIPELNRRHPEDQGKWGALGKPFIPSDIVVWQDTREHWDVLTNTGPFWQYDGLIEGGWSWVQVLPTGGGLPFPPGEEPVPSTHEDNMKAMFQVVFNHLMNIEEQNKRIEQRVNDVMGKLEHYDREFEEIRPELEALLRTLAQFLGGESLTNGIGGILGGLVRGKKK